MAIRTKRKKTISIVLIIAGIAAIIFAIWLYISTHQGAVKQSTGTTSQVKPSASIDSKITALTKQARQGGAEAAVKEIDQAIQSSESNADKSALYTAKATIQRSDGKVDEALQSALAAANQQETEDNCNFVAELYELRGDKTNAIVYYKKALVKFDERQSTLRSENYDRTYYTSRIEGLGGSVR